jgi:protein-tyrosine-phosphatase
MGDYARAPWGADVPDPYYTRDFAQTLDILENAIDGMLTDLGHSAL